MNSKGASSVFPVSNWPVRRRNFQCCALECATTSRESRRSKNPTRELEVVHLVWTDVSVELQTVRVTAKPELGFYPKRWEEREVPIPVQLIGLLRVHTRRPGCNFVFSSPKGNREYHMLDHCKAVAKRRARSRQIRPEDIPIYVRFADAPDWLRRPHRTALDGA